MAQHMTLLAHCLAGALLIVPFPAFAGDAGRDPTLPPASIDAPAVNNDGNTAPVQFISIHGKQRTAIVRGTTVSIGDRINEGRIIGITANGIRIKSDDGISELKLFPDVNKHKHTSKPITSIRSMQR